MKVNRILFHGLVLIAAVGLMGCATNYVPRADSPNPELVAGLPAGTKIALINAQPATEFVLIGKAGMGRSVKGNLHAWTGQAIVAIKRSLEKKGVQVSNDSNKSLKIAITQAELNEAGAGWSFRCTVHFTIETSDGQVITLEANDPSWKYLNACDGAILKTALVALTDERVVKFLSNR